MIDPHPPHSLPPHLAPGLAPGQAASEGAPPRPWFVLGLALVAISFALWAPLPLLPWLPLPGASKAGLGLALFAGAEVTFWGGVMLAGREGARRLSGRIRRRALLRRTGRRPDDRDRAAWPRALGAGGR